MPARMTATAWDRGAKNALICGAIFVGGWCLAAVLVAAVTRWSVRDAFWPAFAVLWGLLLLAFLGTWLYGLNAGGRVLLDCGPHPARLLFMLNAALFLVLGGMGGFAGLAWKSFGITSLVFGITFGVYWVIMATGRLQVREGGLWQYWALLRWDKIECCR